MYPFFLQVHSIVRFIILILLVGAIIRFVLAKVFKRQYNETDDKVSLVVLVFVHLQFLLGVLLYFISPITKSAMENMASAMKDETMRFWAVEHLSIMILAVIMITVGRIRTKKDKLRSDERFRRLIIFYSIGLVLMIAGIPWERLFP